MKSPLFFISLLLSFLGYSQTQFHDTTGTIEVNASGQAQFTLPIAIPPGIKSVAPEVSLIYTSGTGNGLAGYGWALSGLTAISRIPHSLDSDEEIQSVKLDYSDYYAFNGQRLILKSGEYGKDGAEYVTEKYSNVKIKSVGSISGQVWKGPVYWEVTFEDGSQAIYGSATPLEYNIVSWKDAQGNSIFYEYNNQTLTNNTAVISSIEWGGNDILNKPHYNKVQFNYSDRNLAEESYVGGVRFVQNKILNEIVVTSSNAPFKKYAVEYFNNGTNYQLVNKITEFNSENSAANPITFTYPSLIPSSVDQDYISNSDPFSGVRLTGDFNGDSYLDFIMSNGNVKLGAFNNDSFSNIATNKIFSTEAKVVGTLLDEEGQVYNGNGIVQYENGYLCGYIFRDNTFVKVFNKLIYQNDCDPFSTICSVTAKIQNGDINGDGIEDIFVRLNKRECFGGGLDPGTLDKNPEAKLPPGTQCFTNEIGNYIVDLKHVDNPVSTYTLDAGINEASYTEQKYLDVDNDGKVDIINVTNSAYTVFEFQKIAANEYLKKIRFSNNLVEAKDPAFPILFGDFNGDGKLDFTIPVTDNAINKGDNWRFYIGTGTGFNNFLKVEFLTYRKPTATGNNPSFVHQYNFMVADMNKDGKSDVVQLYSYNQAVTQSYRNFAYVISTRISNGSVPGSINFSSPQSFSSPVYGVNDINDFTLFSPLTNPIKANNNYYNVFFYWKQHLHRYKAPTSISELSRIKSVNQGNNSLVTNIYYSEAVPTSLNIYKKEKKEFYPYYSLARLDQSFVVSQLEQAGRMQDFRYRGMTGQMQGKGMLGFYQTARSSWYAYNYENTKIWSGIQMDPLKDGLPVKEWTIRTNNESLIFPVDISENNSQLLSFSSTEYRKDYLLDGQLVTIYADSDKPRLVKAILSTNTRSKNFLTGIINDTSIEYGNFYLPSIKNSVVNNGYATETSTFTYQNNISGTGSAYFIGLLESKTDVIQAYGDTKISKEEYTYQNNLVRTKKTWNRDNSAYILETCNYDSFGNIIQKTITNSTDLQSENSLAQYDPKGRFVIKKTDNLGLETSFSYNNLGQMLSQTDPLGNVITNTYDSWSKLLTASSNLTGTTTYNYSKDANFNTIVSENDPNGNISIKYTDRFGRNYKTSAKAFGQGQFISAETDYDILGREKRKSDPYFEGQSYIPWSLIYYDDNFYPSKVTGISSNGKQIETSVTGLTTTSAELNGYTRTSSKVQDALGNVITSTDKGGTVVFKYNAIGQQIQATYQTNKVITKYDVWDRKSEFSDPSNGVYKYEYNGMGQIKKQISPKGNKQYIYNNLGQLITQNETSDDGVSTHKSITISYDQFGRISGKSGSSNGKLYSSSFTFDQYGRVIALIEYSNDKSYSHRNIVYDNFSRVSTYNKNLRSASLTTEVTIKNEYSPWNGELYRIKDNTSGNVLWELQESNARGQILSAKLGASTITNLYNNYGFLTSTNHSSSVKPGILQISYSFDAIKNELNSRVTGGDFTISESFTYDDNNRLISWTNPRTGQNSSNTYDGKGRITYNDQLGIVKFENTGKLYQPSSIELNAAGTQNYTNDLLQTVTYNENNDPIFLNGVKGDVRFEYGLTNMRQRVTYGGNFATNGDGKFTKFYSEDGSFEVIKDNTTGLEKHVLYIGGTPYESSIVFIKSYSENTGSYKFLHKDYIGSILAISDAAGNKLEQRHYDAWGNFTHLQIANGPVITDKNTIDASSLLLERGYTSHEHFAEVGIIHMNGRLYDPLLRRFLNADENIQDIYNTQNYNKYGYVMNNPLMYSDLNGEWFGLDDLIVAGVSFVIGYVSHGITTGNWGWSAVKSGLQMALMGWISYNTAGIASAGSGAITGSSGTAMWNFIANTAINTAVSSVVPPINISVGKVDFSVSPSVAIGKGWGFGANVSTTFRAGRFNLSYGFGVMHYGGHSGSGLSGWEYRESAMLGYTSKDFSMSLGTNVWSGLHSQQTGIISLGSRNFSLTYENDGSPFDKKIPKDVLADGNDRWRTAAMTINYKDFHAGFNLFTGVRTFDSYSNEGGIDTFTMAAMFVAHLNGFGDAPGGFGANLRYGLVEEKGPRYRLGAAYVGWGNYRFGIDSDRHVRHPIQNILAHTKLSPQPGFEVLSGGVKPYFQYQTRNMFTSW